MVKPPYGIRARVKTMVFHRKKPSSGASPGLPRSRGRENAGKAPDRADSALENPLARRFQADKEPDTADLELADGFHYAAGEQQDVPTTRILSADSGDETLPESQVLQDPVSGFIAMLELSMAGNGSNVVQME